MNINNNRDISVIIPAAGSGKRMRNTSLPKAFIILAGQTLLARSLDKFSSLPGIREIIIAVNRESWIRAERLVSEYPFGFSSRDPSGSRDKAKLLATRPNGSSGRRGTLPEIKLVKGGKERCDSVYNALKIINSNSRIILIHDAARPLVEKGDIIRLIKAVRKNGAAILAVPVVDTIKRVNKNQQINGFILNGLVLRNEGFTVKETLPRQELWAAQTPQGFKKDILMKAYDEFLKKKTIITDEASMVENIGYPIKIVPGSYTNIKITTPADKIFAQELLNFTKV